MPQGAEAATFTEVATNAIWRESIKREQSSAKLRTVFSIPDPGRVPIVTEKPNRISPLTFADAEELKAAPERLRALATLKDTEVPPPLKYELPQTANQEVGWHSRPLNQTAISRDLFYAPRGSCDVTLYASAYFAMTGTTPFSRPGGGAPPPG